VEYCSPYTQALDDFYATDDLIDTQLNIDFDSDDAYYNPFKDGFDSKYVPGGEKD
jgi:hypothetical protein